VGDGCRVAGGCRLDRTVVTAGAAVGANCSLRGCVVAGPVTVPAGLVLEDRLVLPDGVHRL